jgi:hypothetical protein
MVRMDLFVGFGKVFIVDIAYSDGVFDIVFISVLLRTVIVVIAFSKGGFEIVYISALYCDHHCRLMAIAKGVTQCHSEEC